MNPIVEWFKRRFCDHAFQKVESRMEFIYGSHCCVRTYQCLKCGIQVHTDYESLSN